MSTFNTLIRVIVLIGVEDDSQTDWYRSRIGEPKTDDEVYGYWVFVFGILVGVFGLLLYLSSFGEPTAFPAKAGIALSAVALVTFLAVV